MVCNALVQQRTDMPAQVRARRDEVFIHCPMKIWRQRQTIARIVVTRLTEWMNMRCFNQ